MVEKFSIIDGKICAAVGECQSPIYIYANPTEEERRELVSKFLIDEHTLVSALDPDEPARVEQEPDHSVLIFKRPKNYSGDQQFLFKVSSLGLFLYKDKLVIVMAEDVKLFSARIFASVKSLEEAGLKVLYVCIHHYIEHLKIITQISDEIETRISVSMENKQLLNLFSLEKSLVYYLSAINANGFVLERFKVILAKTGAASELVELIDDLIIENTQCYRQAEIHSNILASLMDARVSIVSNNLNILMKNLNLVTILIMVPTLVVSAFSMNVAIPLDKHPLAFLLVLGLSALSAVFVGVVWMNYSSRLTKSSGR